MYRNFNNYHSETRTMEIHQGKDGWYFTICEGPTLIFSSPEDSDRVRCTQTGMSYLDTLQRLDNEARKSNGQ